MQEIIRIENREFNGENRQIVNARDLHAGLEVQTKFADWIKRVIDKAQIIENIDYVSLLKTEKREVGATQSKEYILTVDAAKHISMMEGTEKGKQVRLYFIEREKQARQLLAVQAAPVGDAIERKAYDTLQVWINAGKLLRVPEHVAQIEAVKHVEARTGINFTPLLTASPAMKAIADNEVYLEPTEIGERLGMGEGKAAARKLNEFLAYIEWQERSAGEWVAIGEGKLHSNRHAWKSENGTKSGYNLAWRLSAVKQKWDEVQSFTERGAGE